MRKGILILTLSAFFFSCSKEKSAKPAANPLAAGLVAPAKDQLCAEGQIISDTESKVSFKWNTADNADSYEVVVKNLLTNASKSETTTATSIDLTLLRDTPYSWYVISKSGKVSTTAQSSTWRFYNPGPGVLTHAPFPAEIVAPASAATVDAVNGKISLDWNGSDADNDISSYDVYLGTTAEPSLLSSNVTASVLNDVAVSSGAYYYWKVITHDSKGNTSDSGVFYFKVN